MQTFKKGDRVRISANGHEHIRPIDGATGTIQVVGAIFFADIYEVVVDGPYPTAKSFYGEPYIDSGWNIAGEHLTPLADEDAPNDPASTPTAYNVGDRVEIIGSAREGLLSYGDEEEDADTQIFAEIVALEGTRGVGVLPDEKRFQNDMGDGTWYVEFAEMRPAATEATLQKGGNDPKRINVETIKPKALAEAMIGDDRPSAPSQAFKDAMCAMLIGGYEKYGDGFVSDEPPEKLAKKKRRTTKKDASA